MSQALVEHFLRYTATTVGRDKVYRAIQYWARFYAWYSLRKGGSKEQVERWNNLKNAIGLTRKLMRVAKPVEHLNLAVKSLSLEDDILRICTIGRQLGYAGFLFFDMLLWIHGAKVYNFKNVKRYSDFSNRFWLAGLIFSAIGSAHKYRITSMHLQVVERRHRAAVSLEKVDADYSVQRQTLTRDRNAASKQFVQDALDMLIPAFNLELVNLDDGIVGLAGTVTSIMGIKDQWAKVSIRK
ncbi:uncharacterized protein VTP21DRAFT_2351 [Calcarisporiella thermophila]|uniref:uncharacterized protein n=1 Tax=Calcarisporiella thermophila TaxID=911321 RepID=UPI003742BFD1